MATKIWNLHKCLKAQSHWGTVWHGHTRKEKKPRTGNQHPQAPVSAGKRRWASVIVHFQAITASLFAASASIRRLPRINFLFKNSWPSVAVRGRPIIRESAQRHSEMVYIHRGHRTYTVGIVGVRDGAQTRNGSPYTPLQGGAPTLAHAVPTLFYTVMQ